MYLTIILLPFIGSIISGLFGRSLGTTGSIITSTISISISAILSLIAFYEVGFGRSPVSLNIISWIDTSSITVSWSFLFDDLTVSILLAVLIVSSLVHLYSASYIEADPHIQRFMSYLSLFTAFMVMLVTGDNLFIMFVGWEGIGIVSYLLIGFWLTRLQANKAAIKAITVNRFGDMIITMGFFAFLWIMQSIDYSVIITIAPLLNETVLTAIGLILFGGAISKSAQVPLHTWLPDAMEGPTPVSALIHAATLVTAGIYVILRCSPLLEYAPTSLLIITWVGSLTAFFAASTGLLQNDLKRVIAYSTCSQLGYMILSLGLSQFNIALFHLVTHAFFKALLFLAAGAVIHGIIDQQDLRRLGGLVSYIPLAYTAILIGSLSLMAIPWMTGFYSKDTILELAAGSFTVSGTVAYTIGTLSAGLTAFYSIRLLSLTFFTKPSANQSSYMNAHESSMIIVVPLVVLSVFAIIFGYIASDLYRGPGSDFLGSSIHLHPNHIAVIDGEFATSLIIKLLPVIVSIIGAILAIYLYHVTPNYIIEMTSPITLGRSIYTFLNAKWYIDTVATRIIINPALSLGYSISKIVDRGIIEATGPYGISTILPIVGKNVARFDTGIITAYALYIVLGILSLVLVLYVPIIFDNSINIDFSLVLVYLVTMSILPIIMSISKMNNRN